MDAEAQDSFREFVANRSSALLKTAVLLSGGDRYAAEDLLQNALIKAAGRWHRIDEPEAYVRQILYRQQVSLWRLKWPRRERSVAEPPETGTDADTSSAAELRLVMRGALSRLTARQRTVLVLRYFEDLPEADVARLLGCSVGTVRSTTHRSLARLRTLAPELAALGPAEAEQPQPSRLLARGGASVNVEELMRDSLREQAAEQAPAEPGFADRVLTARRRRRTRTLASVAAATAAVVAIAVAVPLLDSGKDDVRPAGVTQQGGISADPDRSQPRDMIAAGRQVLAAYYTAKAVPQTKDTATFQRTYWLLDPKTGKYKKDTRWSYVAVAPGLKTAAVLERTLPAQRIGLLDLATGEVERWIPAGRGVGALAFSSDGRRLVATTYDEDPDGLVPVENGVTGAMSWMAPHGSSRTGFFVLDLAGNSGYPWWRVANDRDVMSRADFAFTRDGKHLFAKVTGEKDGMERFYDLSGKEVDPPAEEKYLRWDVPARLSPDGRLAALGLIHEVDAGKTYSAKWYSSIRDPRTGKKITMVRGGHLLAWVDNKRLIAWERTTAFDKQPFRDRLVLVTIGSDKVVPLSGSRAQNLEEPPWEPVFAER